MKKVRCVEGASSSFLNKGEVYKVIQEEGELFYTLENSKGVIRDGWLKSRFEDVIDEQEEKMYVMRLGLSIIGPYSMEEVMEELKELDRPEDWLVYELGQKLKPSIELTLVKEH